jgi:hypothetical protein
MVFAKFRSSIILFGSLFGAISVTVFTNHHLSQLYPLIPSLKNIDTELPPDDRIKSPATIHSPASRSNDKLPRVLAIYFPQYHQDPLNDKNWGANFTDWNSLKGAPEKNRAGFEIPRPTELGYYDLTETHTRRRQGELAKEYGIDGFIYHHYWFYDREHPGPNLAAPLLNMLQDGQPDVPFFLNWCATRWVNVWMGKAIFQTIPTNKNRAIVLQDQYFNPTPEEIQEHYSWLSQFFNHKNYIKIDNQPIMLLYIYDERALPILNELRELAKKDGFDGIYWIVGRSAAPDNLFVPRNMTERTEQIMQKKTQNLDMFPLDDIFNQSMTYPYPLEWITSTYNVPDWCHKEGKNREEVTPHTRQEVTGLLTSFDNTPRREFKTATIYGADTPERIMGRFKTNLRAALHYSTCCQKQTNDRFIAINAWNEWGEGMALEPSDVYGRGFLEIIRDIKAELHQNGCGTVISTRH